MVNLEQIDPYGKWDFGKFYKLQVKKMKLGWSPSLKKLIEKVTTLHIGSKHIKGKCISERYYPETLEQFLLKNPRF